MPANTSAEIGIRELRAALSEVVNETAVRGRITYVTSRGRRVAAVVSVPEAEQIESGLTLEAIRDGVHALLFSTSTSAAVRDLLREARGCLELAMQQTADERAARNIAKG